MKRIVGLVLLAGLLASGALFGQARLKLTWSSASVPGDAHTQAM